jgi:hypothetical protein
MCTIKLLLCVSNKVDTVQLVSITSASSCELLCCCMNALKPLLEKDLLKMVTVKYYINQLVVPLKLADKNA